jgi:hypothetical protein
MSSRISLMSEIPLNTLPRTLTRSLKCSRFRRLGALNRSFRIRLRTPARSLHAFSHLKALWNFISVAELGLGINSKWQSSQSLINCHCQKL